MGEGYKFRFIIFENMKGETVAIGFARRATEFDVRARGAEGDRHREVEGLVGTPAPLFTEVPRSREFSEVMSARIGARAR